VWDGVFFVKVGLYLVVPEIYCIYISHTDGPTQQARWATEIIARATINAVLDFAWVGAIPIHHPWVMVTNHLLRGFTR
jgi:hypothetical protein